MAFDRDAAEIASAHRFDDEDEFANAPAEPGLEPQDDDRVDLMQRLIMTTRKLELWRD